MLLAGIACSESQPLPDIEATVEARVELAKASLVAPSPVPLPTYKPLPTYTPAPTPLPEVVINVTVVIFGTAASPSIDYMPPAAKGRIPASSGTI